MKRLVNLYVQSPEFNRLRDKTKVDYTRFLKVLTDRFGEKTANSVTGKDAKIAYEEWVKRGIQLANHVAVVSGRAYRYGLDMEYVKNNPFALVRKLTPASRNVVWTEDQVREFLNVAYGDFVYRNVGLIVQMAYEWCQRVGDMRMLLWNAIDLNKGRCDFEQSKRGEAVHLPISDGLMHVLRQQYETFSFQVLVAPQIQPSDGAYKPYSKEGLHVHVNAILKEAGLPSHLTAMDMRRTAITEMVEAGVDITQIKQVSGHTSINSLTPYIKHTYTGASEALAQRNAYKDSTDG